jgi:hypothetical protein
MSKKSLKSPYVQKPMSAEKWGMFVWSLQQMLNVVPINFNTTFSSSLHRGTNSVKKFLVPFVSPDRHSPLVAILPLSLIGCIYTKVFWSPHSQKSKWLRSVDHAGQLTGLPHPIYCSLKLWFRFCLTMHRKWGGAHHACTTSTAIDEEAHVQRVLLNHTQKNDSTLYLLICSVRQMVLKGWLPKMPTQTLMENRCCCLDTTVAWGLSLSQTWVLWKFMIPSLVNPASSINRMLATNCVFRIHFARSHRQNTTFAIW